MANKFSIEGRPGTPGQPGNSSMTKPMTPTQNQSPSMSMGTPTSGTSLSTPTSPGLLPPNMALMGKANVDAGSGGPTMPPSGDTETKKDNVVTPVGGGPAVNVGTGKPVNAQPIADQTGQPQNTQTIQSQQSPMQTGQPQNNPTKQDPIDFNQINYNFSTQVESLIGTINDLKASLAKDDGSQAMIASWYADMEQSLNAAYQQMVKDMNSQMSAQDPAVLAAIQALKEEVGMQRQSMFEELNARGLAQSGILAEMDLRMRRGELSEVQKLTSARLSELKSQVMVAIQNFAQQRAGLMQQAFQAKTQALQGSLDRKAQLTGQLLGAQGQLTNTMGQWGAAQMQYDATLKGYANSQQLANIQGQYGLQNTQLQGNFGLQNTQLQIQGEKDVAGLKLQGEKDLTGMQIQGQKDITGMQIEGQKSLKQMDIDAEAKKWDAQLAQNMEIAKLDAGTRMSIAQLQAQNQYSIAQMSSSNEILALQMKAASDQAANVILPLVVSGKLDPEAFKAQIKGMPAEVQQMYTPLLDALSKGAAQKLPGSSPVSTPTWSSNPTVAADQQAQYATRIEESIRNDTAMLSKLEANLKTLESGYASTNSSSPMTPFVVGGGPVPSLKQATTSQIEQLQQQINQIRTRITQNQTILGQFKSGITTPTSSTIPQ